MKSQLLELNKDKIIEMYYNDKQSCALIAKNFGVHGRTIGEFLKKKGLILRKSNAHFQKYSINENYFNTIDTSDKAYFLGFLYADGWIAKNGFGIKLQEEDSYILEKMKKYMKSDHKLHYRISKILKRKNTYSFIVTSAKLRQALIKLGCEERKSLILKFPTEEQVPKEFLPHFIRGYFDGDGCVSIEKRGISYCNINICVSEDFGQKLSLFCKSELGVKSPTLHKRENTKIHILHFGGRFQTLKFLNWIYSSDITFLYLYRKYERYLSIKNFQRLKPKSTSYFGVSKVTGKMKYVTVVFDKGVRYHIGYFQTPEEGAKAYNDFILMNNLNRELNIIQE